MTSDSSKYRRSFLKKASLGALAAISIPEIVEAAFKMESPKKISLKENATILFQGDSITDAFRNKEQSRPNHPEDLGRGYAFLAAAELLYQFPDKNLQVLNKGISGHKVFQLDERWEKDCLEIKPDVLSILIGVNDFWHKLNGRYNGDVKVYRDDFAKLLERTKENLPDVQLIIAEPFAVTGTSAVNDKWFPEFDGYREAAKETAEKFGAVFIPLQSIFDEAEKSAPGEYWTPDGVHPSLAGANLMAHAWLATLQS